MARDRTSEFRKAIELVQSQELNSGHELRSRRNVKPSQNASISSYESYNEFMKRSREVAKDLFQTYQRLEELNRLAKKTTIFDWEETSRELNNLVFTIKQDIQNLTRQVDDLRKYQNTAVSSSFRSKNQNMESHSQTVILNLQQQLATMSSDFRNTLEIRSQNNQQQRARREKFSSPEAASMMARNQSTAIIDFGDSGGFSSSNSRLQQQQLLTYEDNNVQYLEERANAMQSVESTIVELGTIFNQLATMVQQQEEMITRIDTNVTDAAMNVESAHQSLLQYFSSVSNNRWLILKVFGVLFVFFVLFVALA